MGAALRFSPSDHQCSQFSTLSTLRMLIVIAAVNRQASGALWATETYVGRSKPLGIRPRGSMSS